MRRIMYDLFINLLFFSIIPYMHLWLFSYTFYRHSEIPSPIYASGEAHIDWCMIHPTTPQQGNEEFLLYWLGCRLQVKLSFSLMHQTGSKSLGLLIDQLLVWVLKPYLLLLLLLWLLFSLLSPSCCYINSLIFFNETSYESALKKKFKAWNYQLHIRALNASRSRLQPPPNEYGVWEQAA